MNNINKMKVTARKLARAIEECGVMGWGDTKAFYQSRLEKLNCEIVEREVFLANCANTKGLPLPKSTF